jgi:MerR family transcriptional regulator, light-induced transcriptional regulator
MDNRERPQQQTPQPATGLGATPPSATDRHRETRPAAHPRPDKSLAGFPSDVELFPIRTVSSLTGVNAITLRAWERRYGLVRPVRTPTGHRLYRRDEIDLIHRIVALIDKGISISQVQRVLSQRPPVEQSESPDEDPFWAHHRRRMLSAIAQFDDQALEDVCHEALGVCAIGPITERLLVPVADQLARRRDTVEDSIAHERFFETYLRSKLGTRFLHRARGLDGPRLLGTCVPGEHIEIGMHLFALTAHEVGLRSVLLGADTPLAVLKAAASGAQCEAIVLSGSIAPPPEVLTELPKLVAGVAMPVYVRGVASIHRRDQVVAAGAIPLGNDLVAGAKRVSDRLRANKR